MVREVLLLGNKELYEVSEEWKKEDLKQLPPIVEDLHDTLMNFKQKYGAGRAIAAPQIGIKKRLLYMLYIDKPVIFLNPKLYFPDEEQMEVLDDCMSFPNLFVKVKRYKRCVITYKNENWEDCRLELEGDFSELLQHEYDHLDGILATMRAIDKKSFYMKQ